MQSKQLVANLNTQRRRNSTHPRLRRAQCPPIHDLQPHAHAPRRFPCCAELFRESVPGRRNRRLCFLRRLCADRAHKMPRPGLDRETRNFMVDSEADMDQGWSQRAILRRWDHQYT